MSRPTIDFSLLVESITSTGVQGTETPSARFDVGLRTPVAS
jgi:hypothetical protein